MTRQRFADRVAAIDAVYARVPAIDCKGKCHDSCGPIAMTGVERERLRRAGQEIYIDGSRAKPGRMMTCSALTVLNRCAQYAIRPAICRVWGLTETMQCSYGCVPEGGFWTDAQAYDFLADVAEAAGEPVDARRFRRLAMDPDVSQIVAYSRAQGIAGYLRNR